VHLFDFWAQVGYVPHDLMVQYRGDVSGGLLRFDRLQNMWVVSPAAMVEH
jgi:hypothetical protein